MQSHLAANMCKIEQSGPSRSVESEPENVLNALSPGRSTRWILPAELETPNRPTSSGLQSPVGVPAQLGPSPSTQEYVRQAPCGIPPAQWGDLHAREGDDGFELFGNMPEADDLDLPGDPARNAAQQDELENAEVLPLVHAQQSPTSGARCVNGNLVRPDNAEEETPSTACRQSAVNAPGGALLGRGTPGFGKSPGIIPGRQLTPPPPPPPPVPHAPAASTAANFPRAWAPLNTQSDGTGGGTGSGAGHHSNSGRNPGSGGGAAGSNGSGGGVPSGGAPPPGGGNPGGNAGGSTPPGQTPPQQSGGAGYPGSMPPTPPSLPHQGRHSDPWAPLDRSREALPKLALPSNYKNCSILDMQQILESWYDMISPHSLLQLGEVMLKGIGIHKYWTVRGPSTMYGFKAVHLSEQV